jgi:hypothetical protein
MYTVVQCTVGTVTVPIHSQHVEHQRYQKKI